MVILLAHLSHFLDPLPQDKQSTERIEAIAANAQAKVTEGRSAVRDKDWFKRSITVPTAPIFIASTEDIGTDSVRANHVDGKALLGIIGDKSCVVLATLSVQEVSSHHTLSLSIFLYHLRFLFDASSCLRIPTK